MGLGLICLAFLVERVAIEPPGIYAYSREGYKGFTMGLAREGVLREINQIKSIRALLTCDPQTELKLTSRRGFEMSEALTRSDIWICLAKKQGILLFQFNSLGLERVLRIKGRPASGETALLFAFCPLDSHQDLEAYLARHTGYPVFDKDGDTP